MSTNSIQSRDPTGVLRRAAKAQLGASYGGGGGGFAVTSGSYGGYGAGAGAGAGGGGGNVNIAVAQDLLNRAVKISEEELVEDTVDMRARNTDMHRVVVKKVHVPVKRRVKVPVTTLGKTKAMETRRVKTKKLVPVQGWKEVEEEYTVVEQRARTRDKVVWVKKIVQEEYMEPYTVKKKRMKKVPITQFKEVESYQDVQVEVEKPVEVQGYRVDEVEDVKEVEVEEEEVYQLVPQVRARRFLGTRYASAGVIGWLVLCVLFLLTKLCVCFVFHSETGVFQQANLSRTVGTKTYRAEEVQGIETDAHLSNVRLIDPIPLTATMKMHVEHVRQWLGITVRYTKGGLHVIRVQAGGPASRGGMCVGDWIVKVGGTRVTTLAALRSCLYSVCLFVLVLLDAPCFLYHHLTPHSTSTRTSTVLWLCQHWRRPWRPSHCAAHHQELEQLLQRRLRLQWHQGRGCSLLGSPQRRLQLVLQHHRGRRVLQPPRLEHHDSARPVQHWRLYSPWPRHPRAPRASQPRC